MTASNKIDRNTEYCKMSWCSRQMWPYMKPRWVSLCQAVAAIPPSKYPQKCHKIPRVVCSFPEIQQINNIQINLPTLQPIMTQQISHLFRPVSNCSLAVQKHTPRTRHGRHGEVSSMVHVRLEKRRALQTRATGLYQYLPVHGLRYLDEQAVDSVNVHKCSNWGYATHLLGSTWIYLGDLILFHYLELSGMHHDASPWDELLLLVGIGLVVNRTSLGLAGTPTAAVSSYTSTINQWVVVCSNPPPRKTHACQQTKETHTRSC